MTITAIDGPLITRRSSLLPAPFGTGSANQNPQAAPSPLEMGTALLDTRTPFTYYPGGDVSAKTYGWLAGGQGYQCIDAVPSTISAVNIAAGQSVTAATPMTLVSSSGAGITVGVSITRADTWTTVTGLLAIDSAMAGVGFGQDATVNMWDPTKAIARTVRITTNADDTGGTYTVVGYDLYGYPMSQVVTGVNNAVCTTTKAFKYIASVTPGGTLNSTSVSVGTGDVIGLPLRVDRIPYLQVWWGNPQNLEVGPGGAVTAAEQVIQIPVLDVSIINSAVFKADVPFSFTLKSAQFRTGQIATGSGAAATITATVGGTAITGGVLTLSLANQNASGNTVAASAMSGAALTSPAGSIEWTVSGVTAWTAGTGYIEMVVVNNDLAGGVFTAAVTTNPSTTLTGDVRGTVSLPSASDGTKRLTVFIVPSVANINSVTGVYGVAENLASNNG